MSQQPALVPSEEELERLACQAAKSCTERHPYMQGAGYVGWRPHKWVIDAMRAAVGAGAATPAPGAAELVALLRRVTDELDCLNCAQRDGIDDDMAEPEEEAACCDAADELIDEARAAIALYEQLQEGGQ